MSKVTEAHRNRAEVAVDRGSCGWGMAAGHYRDTVNLVAQAIADAEQRGAQRERAAVVRWLWVCDYADTADYIKAGKHRESEDE